MSHLNLKGTPERQALNKARRDQSIRPLLDVDKVEEHIEKNVTDLASAKKAIKQLARMVAILMSEKK